MRTLCLLLLLASGASTASGAHAQTPGTLVFFDRFDGAPVAVDQHAPVLDASGAGWRVEGTGAFPQTTTSAINFEPGAQTAAVAEAHPGDRTVTYTIRQPAGHTADATAFFFVRYQDPGTHLALRLRWGPAPTYGQPGPDAQLTLDRVQDGALVSRQPVASVPHSGYERPLRFDVETQGATVSVWLDGEPLASVSDSHLAGAQAFGFAADVPPRPNGGTYGVVFDVAVTTPAALPTDVCPGLSGWTAESCVRADYAPLATLDYDAARDELFTWLWAAPASGAAGRSTGLDREVEGVYGGAVSTWRHDYALSPREQVQDDGFNTEHVWPRSRGAQPGTSTFHPAHNDLHHLAPALSTFNSARSNRAFGDAFDHPNDTHKWLRGRTVRYASSGPPSATREYSRVERDFLRQPDDGDGHKELGELGRFDVRHDRRGDVARAAAYFLTLYRIEAEDGDEGRAFIEETLDVLLAWHLADPVDTAERTRNERIYRVQGNRNPYVLDATLLSRALYDGASQPHPRGVWINEVHHSNDGPDTGEGVEIAGPAGTDLYGYRVWAYSGYGGLYQVDGDGVDRSPAIAFRGEIDDEGGGLGAVWAYAQGLRGGCQGLALTDPDGGVIEFVSTGGCRFNALDGPVFDAARASGAESPSHPDSLVWSTGIRGSRPAPGQPHRRVQEWSTLPAGHSIQLTGAGSTRADFAWGGPLPHSRGRLNDYQAPAAAANRVTGWAAGHAVPLGLLAPRVDLGLGEDAPQLDAIPRDELTVSLPAPNPTASSTRLHVAAPASSTVTAEVFDALGRRVDRLAPASGVVTLDARSLAPGTYAVRVTASRPDQAPQVVTRHFTVLR